MDVPEGCEDYRMFVAVRCPFQRAGSLFRHFIKAHPKDPRGGKYDTFWRWLAGPVEEPFYQWTLSRWYEGLDIFASLSVESLARDLQFWELIDEAAEVPRLNATLPSADLWREPYLECPECLTVARRWAWADFALGGYQA